jgi:phosphatidylglycerophosphate synthase
MSQENQTPPVVATEPIHPALAHQRPDGVLGEWNNLPEEDWNIHQRIAEKTGGWATAANLISLVGAAATAKGMYDFIKGKHGQGLAEIGVGRTLDLADGMAAKRFGTRSKTGAAVDAGADKLLVAGASVALSKAGVIPKRYAIATGAQQVRIAAENATIQKAGGEPNPSKDGKHSMAAIWLSIGGRAAEYMLKKRGHEKTAKLAGATALASEVASLALSEKAIAGYRGQRKMLKK